jgi:hypothetical protein
VEEIKKLDPNANIIGGSIERLQKQLNELEENLELNDWDVTLLDGLEEFETQVKKHTLITKST